MSTTLQIFILAATAALTSAAFAMHSKPNCEEFSKDVTFNENSSLGMWYLQHYSPSNNSDPKYVHCIEFATVDVQERENLTARLGRYVNGLNWERLRLKLIMLCPTDNPSKQRTHYLEKMADNGSFRTLEALDPPATYHLYPMRLRVIDPDFMVMMDCNEKFIFVLGRKPRATFSEPMKQFIDSWPEDYMH